VEAVKGEVVEYRRLKKVFEERGPATRDALVDKPSEFMSLEEFAAFRREYSLPFWQAWKKLQQIANEKAMIVGAQNRLWGTKIGKIGYEDEYPYWAAIVELYGVETRSMFGDV
jgi:hypothetical protein